MVILLYSCVNAVEELISAFLVIAEKAAEIFGDAAVGYLIERTFDDLRKKSNHGVTEYIKGLDSPNIKKIDAGNELIIIVPKRKQEDAGA